MSDISSLEGQAATLRRVFDSTFAQAPPSATDPAEDFLALRIGGDAYGVRLAEVAGLHTDRKAVALPSSVPELLGIAGFRGMIIPVYDFGALLGYPLGQAGRWFILVRPPPLVWLTVPVFDGYIRVGRQEVTLTNGTESSRPHVQEILRAGSAIRPVINLASVVEAIRRRVRAAGSPKGA